MASLLHHLLLSIICISDLSLLVTSASLPPTSSLQTNNNWDQAVRKGKYLFAQLESGCYPDDPNPPTLEELRAKGWRLGEPGGVETWPPRQGLYEGFPKWVMRAMDMDTSYFFNPTIQHGTGSDWKDYTEYSNTYSPKHRLLAQVSYNKLPTELVDWSSATFAIWKALTDLIKARIYRIDWIGQTTIEEPSTISIIDLVVPPDPHDVIKTFFSSDENNEKFMALLGTYEGERAALFLLKHKQALRRKTIKRVTIFRDGRGAGGRPDRPHMLFQPWDVRLDNDQQVGTSDFCKTLNQTLPPDLVVES